MEQFKLKSIDELDLEFISATRGQTASVTKESKSIIPEISKNEPEKETESATQHYFKAPAVAPAQENPIYTPAGEPEVKKPRPLVPIGQKPSPYAPVGATEENQEEEILDFSDANYGEAMIEEKPAKAKASGGVLAGKIISIIMLCATVITFILGCFVTIFLDNSGTNIGGICFNTMSQDIDVLGVSEGDLIISKKLNSNEYEYGNLIAVPASGISGCDIQTVTNVSVYSDTDSTLTVSPVSNPSYTYTVQASTCYGVISSYIPVLGSILNFAMDNAILVCLLFVLLSAFWCLILVLMERTSKVENYDTKPKNND